MACVKFLCHFDVNIYTTFNNYSTLTITCKMCSHMLILSNQNVTKMPQQSNSMFEPYSRCQTCYEATQAG